MGKDNFISLTPASPSFGGYYYSVNGTYIGHIDDSSNKEINDAVNVLSVSVPIVPSLIIKSDAGNSSNIATITEMLKNGAIAVRRIDLSPTKFSNDLLLDRCAWMFGEGMGCFPRHYAFAIQNGFLTNNRSERSLYYYLMRERIDGVVQPIPKAQYMSTMNGAKKFNATRNAPSSRDAEQLAVVAAVLESILEPNNDPTHNSNQWRGAARRKEKAGTSSRDSVREDGIFSLNSATILSSRRILNNLLCKSKHFAQVAEDSN